MRRRSIDPIDLRRLILLSQSVLVVYQTHQTRRFQQQPGISVSYQSDVVVRPTLCCWQVFDKYVCFMCRVVPMEGSSFSRNLE